MSARVIGIGNPNAGDDAVSWAIVDALAGRAGGDVALHRLADPSALIDLLAGRVIIIDALLAPERPGCVLVLSERDLERAPPSRLSSHGIGVAQTLSLARALGRSFESTLVAVGIALPSRLPAPLSPEAAAAVPVAVQAILALLAGR